VDRDHADSPLCGHDARPPVYRRSPLLITHARSDGERHRLHGRRKVYCWPICRRRARSCEPLLLLLRRGHSGSTAMRSPEGTHGRGDDDDALPSKGATAPSSVERELSPNYERPSTANKMVHWPNRAGALDRTNRTARQNLVTQGCAGRAGSEAAVTWAASLLLRGSSACRAPSGEGLGLVGGLVFRYRSLSLPLSSGCLSYLVQDVLGGGGGLRLRPAFLY
jgi:hypothetical protein